MCCKRNRCHNKKKCCDFCKRKREICKKDFRVETNCSSNSSSLNSLNSSRTLGFNFNKEELIEKFESVYESYKHPYLLNAERDDVSNVKTRNLRVVTNTRHVDIHNSCGK